MPNNSNTATLTLPSAAARHVAILLECLPERTHKVLLGQLGDQEKRCVSEEWTALDDVDAMERHRVLKRMYEQLHAETQSVERVESEIQDEIQIGRARVAKKPSAAMYRKAEPPQSDSADERPSEPFHQAADPRREPRRETRSQQDAPAVDGGFVANRDVHSESLLVQFQQTQAAGVLPLTTFSHSEAAGVGFPVDRPTRDEQESPTIHSPISAGALESCEAESAWVCDAEELAQRVDWYLNQLTPRQLCRALGMATTKQAFLVLCGLPNETAEKVLALLPRRQSRKVRQDMRRMGRLQLCEIDRAKQAIAEIALRLFSDAEGLAA